MNKRNLLLLLEQIKRCRGAVKGGEEVHGGVRRRGGAKRLAEESGRKEPWAIADVVFSNNPPTKTPAHPQISAQSWHMAHGTCTRKRTCTCTSQICSGLYAERVLRPYWSFGTVMYQI